jgi:hypothetical protein
MAQRPLALQIWWCAFLVGFCCFCLIAFWPGLLSYDSLVQMQQARTGQYDNWHPPLMAWLLSFMDLEHFGARIPLFLTVCTYIASWWFISWRVSPGPRWCWGAVVLGTLVLWPPYWALIGVLWKDVWMALALLATVAVVLVIEHYRWWALAVLFIGCLLAAALRHNGVAATLPLLLILSARIVKPLGWQRAWLWGLVVAAVVAHCVSLWALNRVLYAALGVRERYPAQQILWHDIASVSIETGHNLFRVPAAAGLSLQRLREVYSPVMVATLFSSQVFALTEQEEEIQQLMANWLAVIRDHPWCYLQHRASIFARQFSLTGTRVCYPFHTGVEANDMGLTYNPGLSGRLALGALWILTPLFSGWIYLCLCIAVSVVCCFLSGEDRRPVLAFPFALGVSGGLYGLAYFFVSTTCDYRMHYWTVLAAGVGFGLLVLERVGGWPERACIAARETD